MYYELYIDVLFFMNFMMDSLLLLSVKRIRKYPVKNGRVFLGSAVGAGLTCLIVAIPLPGAVKLLLYHGVVNTVMILAGLGVQKKKEFCRAFLFLYVAAFLMGGILQAMRPWIRTGSLFFAAAVAVYYLSCGIWRGLMRFQERRRQICEVSLHMQTGVFRLEGLIDTGNGLTDPVSGEPVHVVDSGFAREMLKKGEEKEALSKGEWEKIGLRYITYRTVKGEGIMPVFRAREMELGLPGEEKRIRVMRPVIGICEGAISDGEEYQMILNPDSLMRQ